jgi:hypothetical protein
VTRAELIPVVLLVLHRLMNLSYTVTLQGGALNLMLPTILAAAVYSWTVMEVKQTGQRLHEHHQILMGNILAALEVQKHVQETLHF